MMETDVGGGLQLTCLPLHQAAEFAVTSPLTLRSLKLATRATKAAVNSGGVPSLT